MLFFVYLAAIPSKTSAFLDVNTDFNEAAKSLAGVLAMLGRDLPSNLHPLVDNVANTLRDAVNKADKNADRGLDFMEHPLDSIMLFVGGIMLLVVVYKIIAD